LLAKQITSLTVDFSQSIDLYRYQYISYPELRLYYQLAHLSECLKKHNTRLLYPINLKMRVQRELIGF
jgi:hypothetical protein